MFNSSRYNKEKGQGLVEYALILVLVAVVVIVVLALVGPAIGRVFSNVYTGLNGGAVAGGGGGGGGAPTSPAPTPTTPAVLGMGLRHTWTGCSGACTDTWVTCTVTAPFRVLTSSFPNGDPGITINGSCSAGGETKIGNFWHNQTLTLTNMSSGQSQAFVVP
jgi:pilus assembly protein Flp/PilA